MRSAQEAYKDIDRDVIPQVIDHFQEKTRQYRGGPAFMMLGVQGQFSDINRKFWKLYDALWEGNELEGEQPIEICEDMIGHLFLTIWLLKQQPTAANCSCPPDQEPGSYAEGCVFHEAAAQTLELVR